MRRPSTSSLSKVATTLRPSHCHTHPFQSDRRIDPELVEVVGVGEARIFQERDLTLSGLALKLLRMALALPAICIIFGLIVASMKSGGDLGAFFVVGGVAI